MEKENGNRNLNQAKPLTPIIKNEKIIDMSIEEIFDKLKKRFPDGIVIGGAKAIVGQFGLTIFWNNKDGTKSEKRLCEGRMLSIVEIKGDWLEIGEYFPHPLIHYKYFKGFEVKIN